MAQARANIVKGMTAWVSGKPYGPGQFLPGGTEEYAIDQYVNLTPEQMYPGGPSRVYVSIIASVLATTQENAAALLDKLTQGLLDRIWVNTDPHAGETSLEDFEV